MKITFDSLNYEDTKVYVDGVHIGNSRVRQSGITFKALSSVENAPNLEEVALAYLNQCVTIKP